MHELETLQKYFEMMSKKLKQIVHECIMVT
jgi:hypothetical protein